MRVMFSHNLPFSLAHGGMQTLIESLMREIALLGVDVEPERWWDSSQTCDVMHFVMRPQPGITHFAKLKKRKLLMTENADVVASESRQRLLARTVATRAAMKLLPGFRGKLSFYSDLDALVYVVPHEWTMIQQVYGVAPEKGHIIPHGLDPYAIEALSQPEPEVDTLVSVGTICARKNTLLLARCAKLAQVPVLFVGRPFATDDPYFLEFERLIDGKYVRYAGAVSEAKKFEILRGARGSVLLSSGESGCISIYEAAAARLPLLLSDLPWARHGYPPSDRVQLVPLTDENAIAARLKTFYEGAHRGPAMTFPIKTWSQVAQMYVSIYETL